MYETRTWPLAEPQNTMLIVLLGAVADLLYIFVTPEKETFFGARILCNKVGLILIEYRYIVYRDPISNNAVLNLAPHLPCSCSGGWPSSTTDLDAS